MATIARQPPLNYLAHLLLADESDASRIGNLLGDFAKGSLIELEKIYPSELIRGIKMHRAVDRFTDSHAVFKEARTLLAVERRRFAGVIIDIFFDHYLCMHWNKFSDTSLDKFIQEIYRALSKHPEWHAGRLADIFPMMKTEDWLNSYSTIHGIEVVLERVSQRSHRLGKIAGGIDDLRVNYDTFETHFHTFMPDLLEFVAGWKREH